MSRAERRRAEKANKKSSNKFPANKASNYTVNQIAKETGVKIDSLLEWKSAREKEMFEGFRKESQEKLCKAEDYIAVGNILISLFAIKMTWGFTKANQRFIENLNAAKNYLEKIGIEKAYEQVKNEMGIELEFDSIDINKEFGFGDSND